MDDKELEKENIKYLAQRAEVDGIMSAEKAEKLLQRDFEKAKSDPRAAEALKKVLKRDFQIGR